MNSIFTIIGFAGSFASIIGLALSLAHKDNRMWNTILYSAIVVLSLVASCSYYLYHKEIDNKVRIENRKREIKLEAQEMLDNFPTYIDYYNPGENEGLLFGILAWLETNNDILSETYELYKQDVIRKVEKSNDEPDLFKRREQMEIAGESAKQLLKSLAQ